MGNINKWFQRIMHSKTMIAGFIIDIAGVIQLNSDFLSTVLTPHQFGWLLLGIGMLIKGLRYVTTQPLEDK